LNNNATEPAIALGLHTCAGELRRAKLRRSAGRIEVLSLDRQPMGLSSGPQATGGSADNSSLSGSPVATAAVTTNGAVCVATMPSADVMTRLWSMPAADGSRLRQMVAHRLEADLPIPLEQLAWGCRAGKLPESGSPGLTVMAQAARNERVSRQMARLVELGMAVDVLTTEAEAIENLLRLGMREQTPPASDADPEAVILATAYGYLTRDLRSKYQFWTALGDGGWLSRPNQPLTHPYVLRRDWPVGQPWSDVEDLEANREALGRVIQGLAARCTGKVYLAYSELGIGGEEQTGELLHALMRALTVASHA